MSSRGVGSGVGAAVGFGEGVDVGAVVGEGLGDGVAVGSGAGVADGVADGLGARGDAVGVTALVWVPETGGVVASFSVREAPGPDVLFPDVLFKVEAGIGWRPHAAKNRHETRTVMRTILARSLFWLLVFCRMR